MNVRRDASPPGEAQHDPSGSSVPGGRKNPNLKGTISYKRNKYLALIPCTYLQDLSDADLNAMIGKTVRGRIKRINRGTTYELQYDADKF